MELKLMILWRVGTHGRKMQCESRFEWWKFNERGVCTSHFAITVAFCNETVAFCNKKANAFYNKLLLHFVIK